MTNSTDSEDACDCGSGLRAVRCCAQSAFVPPFAEHAFADDLTRSVAAAEADDTDLALALCRQVLDRAPDRIDALSLFARLLAATGPVAAQVAVLLRLQALSPNDTAATQELALQLLRLGRLEDAEIQARNAVRLAPDQALSHVLLANVLTQADKPHAGEFHYSRALEIGPRDAITLANLAWCLKLQGRLDEARALYAEATDLDPSVGLTWLGRAQTEEAGRDLALAAEYLAQAKALDPTLETGAFEAALLTRQGAHEAALALLDESERRRGSPNFDELLARARILDRLGRYDEAFAAAVAGKAQVRSHGYAYAAAEAARRTAQLFDFFTAGRLRMLPRIRTPAPGAQPLFTVGAPRSGTTLVEQILSAHPDVVAGDELGLMEPIVASMPARFDSPVAYPAALAELWMGDRRDGLEELRDDYLRRARLRLPPMAGERFFTDKTPFNETHLGLIGLMFPDAPLVHLVRHPLDIVLSMTFNNLTHGYNCSTDVETAALHLARVLGLVAHYRSEMALRYLPVRYEDLVGDLEGNVRRLLAFVGLDFDARCLRFDTNERYARTASYAQVTEKLYDRSVYRYRSYLRHLQPALEILEPTIEALGYDV
ncbi:tetratricopeptide repeat-containing sulfotransferase family protein [Caulobacter sp. RL271]|uniref:Sulfotransferase n=1 Tax=Caulobacter segnis TaxID=88688 RepID=A0ABY4ZRD5_9CAUL|nr:sulfotransferase [Caulobacter segnis]USQ95220.1 sulfotransferase [Caulobacter segnis]